MIAISVVRTVCGRPTGPIKERIAAGLAGFRRCADSRTFCGHGSLGTRIYENDDAADWSADVTELGLQAVETALDTAIEAEYIEAPDGACALAAADVVARLVSGRGENSAYCEGVVTWVEANGIAPPPALVAKAKTAVERVRGAESELAELWSEDAESLDAWSASLADVELRLSA